MTGELVERIKQLAEARRRSLQDVLVQADVRPGEWTSIQRGIYPGDAVIQRIATVLNVGPEYLWGLLWPPVEGSLRSFLDFLFKNVRCPERAIDIFNRQAPKLAAHSYRHGGRNDERVFRDLIRDEWLGGDVGNGEMGFRDDERLC